MIVFAITIQMTTRSSHQSCSVRKGVLRNFAKFTWKYLRQVLFYNKVAGPEPGTLLKKRLWHICFPMNFAKFQRTPFHRTSLNDCFSTIQHFLAENPVFFFVFEKMSCSISMFLVMLLAHVGKRSNSRSQMFSKTGVLKNLAIFTGKNLCWRSLFLIKFQDWRPTFLFKKRLQRRCFPLNKLCNRSIKTCFSLLNHFPFTEICE